MDQKKAFALAEQVDVEIVTCLARFHTGFLVGDGEGVAIVDDEFFQHTNLPSFIKTKDQAKQYLGELNRAYNDGVEGGQRHLQRQFQRLMNVTPNEL